MRKRRKRRNDFRCMPCKARLKKWHARKQRLYVAKSKRAYFYRTRWWELHYRNCFENARFLKREQKQDERIERRCQKHNLRVAYMKRSMWSWHNGNNGSRAWLEDADGKHIADVPASLYDASFQQLKLFAATCGYDEVIDRHSTSFVME